MKRLFLSIFTLLAALHIDAVPANPRPFIYTQPDGTQITLTLIGDEHAHTYMDSEGYAVTIGDDGYARRSDTDARAMLAARRQTRAKERLKDAEILKTRLRPVSGTDTHGLIILVDFDDLKFTNTQEAIYEQMNAEGYDKNDATGSARDYFTAQSSRQFVPTFDVVGPVTLDMPYRYYGGNNAAGSDRNAATMIFSAVQKAAGNGLVDLTKYDADNDGIVDMVYIIYAGLGEADGGDPNTVWPHMWNLQASAMFAYQQIQGKRLGLYACSAEYRSDQRVEEGKSFSGIGTFCHEYGHCIGLPDIYDVTYSGGYGMASYDVMSHGSYLNNGNTPPNYSGFERYSVGWMMYDDINVERDVTLSPIGDSNTAVRLSSPTNPDEYFVLENRQQEGWDAYLPARGLMITHIDYDEEVWDRNAVNADPDHQHVKMMAADNNWAASTQSGDLYPGLLNNTSFTSTTTPNSLLWDGTNPGKNVTKITMDGTDVSFHVSIDASDVAIPTFNPDKYDRNTASFNTLGQKVNGSFRGIVIKDNKKMTKNQ